MEIITLKNIINAFEDVVNQQLGVYPQHQEIKTFSWGDLSDINTINIKGVLMYVIPTSKEISNQNISRFKFDIYFLDVMNTEVDNRLDLLENTQAVATDILKKMGTQSFKNQYNFNIKSNNDLSVVMMDFEQKCLGWFVSIYAEVYDGSTCKINM